MVHLLIRVDFQSEGVEGIFANIGLRNTKDSSGATIAFPGVTEPPFRPRHIGDLTNRWSSKKNPELPTGQYLACRLHCEGEHDR